MASSRIQRLHEALVEEMLVPVRTKRSGKRIYFYKNKAGKVLASDFMSELKADKAKKMQTAYGKYFLYFDMHSRGKKLVGEKWHLLNGETNLGEYKHNDSQTRMFHLVDGDMHVVLFGITGKKEDKLKPGDVRRAREMMKDYFERRTELAGKIT